MEKVAFIIPAWSGDFSHLKLSLSSFMSCDNDGDCDVFVVMSTEEEKIKFIKESNLQFVSSVKFISLDSFTSGNNTKDLGVINAKKFYGISVCIDLNDYEYMIPIDCESYFLDLVNIKNVCKTICDRKSFFGGRCTEKSVGPRERKINKSCISFLNNYTPSSLDFSDIDSSIFFFWYDLPVYKRDIAISFLDFIDFRNTARLSKNLRWTHFDHILYGYYCAAYHNHSIIETKFHERGIVKRASKEVFLKMKDVFDVSLFWTSLDHYDVKDSCFDSVKVLYHVDKRMNKIKELL